MAIVQTVEKDVVSFFDWLWKNAETALTDIEPYLIPVTSLVSLLFPGAAATATGVANAVALIQQTVVLVQQKYAALNINSSTPSSTQLVDILALVTPAVQSLLASEKITYNSTQVTNVVNAVIAILQAQAAPATAAVQTIPAA
jgi:hypothetical protein